MKPHSALLIAFLLVSLSLKAQAATLSIGDSVALGDSEQVLVSKINDHCETVTIIDNKTPSYPLAELTEKHVLCSSYSKDKVQFAKAVFVVADDQFVQMEAIIKDNAETVIDSLGEKSGSYLGMDVFAAGEYWFDPEMQRLKWLTKDALHPNLFAWNSSLLTSSEVVEYNKTTAIPALLDFDADIDALRPLFDQQCQYVKEDIIESIWLPNKPEQQIQINCFGYEFAGFERKFEAVFGDGKLQVIWILSGKQEESRIRDQLLSDWGSAEITNAKWEVFAKGRIALRKDKPELLVLSDEMIPFYQKDFHQSSED